MTQQTECAACYLALPSFDLLSRSKTARKIYHLYWKENPKSLLAKNKEVNGHYYDNL